MTEVTATTDAEERIKRNKANRAKKKIELAQSAMDALKQLGYANTSLRDIAALSDMSLGALHYYFKDKVELIVFCVQLYKQEFVRNINMALENADGREQVIEGLSNVLAFAIVDDAQTHRLWYDIRTQAMFDDRFKPAVNEIEAALIDAICSSFAKTERDNKAEMDITYAMIDGTFRYLMQDQFSAKPRDHKTLARIFAKVLDGLI